MGKNTKKIEKKIFSTKNFSRQKFCHGHVTKRKNVELFEKNYKKQEKSRLNEFHGEILRTDGVFGSKQQIFRAFLAEKNDFGHF